jgi:SSS family solute:Na+ symporter
MNHPVFPVSGVMTAFLTVGIWYSCTSQHIVQRVLSAKDEWHARTGVVCAGFLHGIAPIFFVIPGIIAYHLYPNLKHPDGAYLTLVKEFIPAGLKGLILAGVAAALMSTLSAVLNSASTLVTIDLYRKFRGRAEDRREVVFGQISGVVMLVLSMLTALEFLRESRSGDNIVSLFVLIQNIFFYIAPPFAVIFTLGLLWRRGTGTAALITIVSGFAFTVLLERVIFPHVAMLTPYNNYYHRALLAWIFCMIVMIAASLLTMPPPPEKTEGIIWTGRYALLPRELQQRYRGIKDFRLWWGVFVVIMAGIYVAFLVNRMKHPVNMIDGWRPGQ